MSDAGRRNFERAAATTGAPEDRARVLVERMRAGVVPAEHLAVAAWLGDDNAALVVPAWAAPRQRTTVPPELAVWPARHAIGNGPLLSAMCVRVAIEFAERVLPILAALRPHEGRPQAALEAARAWVACPCENHRGAAHVAAMAAHAATMDPGRSAEGGGSVALAAHCAAGAAVAHASARAAVAAGYSAEAAVAQLGLDLAYQDRARVCLAARRVEHEWQRLRLIAWLTGDVAA